MPGLLGAVVTTEAIAGQFAADSCYFSTFGGKSVSAAVGLTVLDVTTLEKLPERAERVGEYTRTGIRAIDAERIGHVRGAGLFIGVEIVDGEGRPDAAGASTIVEELRRQGVLIGVTGPKNTSSRFALRSCSRNCTQTSSWRSSAERWSRISALLRRTRSRQVRQTGPTNRWRQTVHGFGFRRRRRTSTTPPTAARELSHLRIGDRTRVG